MGALTRRDFVRTGTARARGRWLPFREDARSVGRHARADKAAPGSRTLAELRRRLHGALLLPGDEGYLEASARSMGATRAYCGRRWGKVADLAVSCPSQNDSPIGPKGSLGSFWSLGWVGGPVVDCLGRRDTRVCIPQSADPADSLLLPCRLQADTPSLLACSRRRGGACSRSSKNRTLRPPTCNSAPAVRIAGDCPRRRPEEEQEEEEEDRQNGRGRRFHGNRHTS